MVSRCNLIILLMVVAFVFIVVINLSEHITGEAIVMTADTVSKGHIWVTGLFILGVVLLGIVCYLKRKN